MALSTELGTFVGPRLAFMLQKGATDPSGHKARYISDPRNEAHDHMDTNRRPKCISPEKNVTLRALFWYRRYQRVPVLIPERDVRAKCKLIPVAFRGRAYMEFRLETYMVVYVALFLGRWPSPGNWGLMAALSMQYASSIGPSDHCNEGNGIFAAYRYVEGGSFVESWLWMRRCISASL